MHFCLMWLLTFPFLFHAMIRLPILDNLIVKKFRSSGFCYLSPLDGSFYDSSLWLKSE